MTLRWRLGLTIAATAAVLAAGLLWLRASLDRDALERGLREFVLTYMQTVGREECEAAPELFPNRMGRRSARRPGGRDPGGMRPPPRGQPPFPQRQPPEADGRPPRRGNLPRGPRRGPGPDPRPGQPRFWAYSGDFSSSNPRAPAFPDDLQRRLQSGDETASVLIAGRGGREILRLATRMPWDEGPCAVMLVERPVPDRSAVDRTTLLSLLILGGGVLCAVLLAAGPTVRRIRRLQREVKQAAASRYVEEVEAHGHDEIATLAAAFNEAGREVRGYLSEVETRERALRDFVADTTHDVMIPLTVLKGHLVDVHQSLEGDAGADPEVVRAALDETQYMTALLQNLSAAAKLEGSAYELERNAVDLGALVERVAARHAPLARLHGLQLDFAIPEQPVSALGDVTLLEQAVSNLVHNAVRYHREDGHVSILLDRVPAAEGPATRFRIQISDDGPGVDEALLQRLGERRFRADAARTRHPQGSGLGLHIAHQVAERHGFDLAFHQASEGGLEVTLEGPIA